MGPRIVGWFDKEFDLQMEKHSLAGTKSQGRLIVLNCADGAKYSISTEKQTIVCSFNTQIWGASMENKIGAASSYNI